MRKVLLFGLLLALTACAYVDPSLTDQTVVYNNAPVRKSTLQVSLHPKGRQYRPLTAYFHPFAIQQNNSDYYHLSTAFAQIFQSAWLEERLFPIMEFESGIPYQGVRTALARARNRGADLLVLGSVPYFYAGHTVDDTAITIKIDIYNAQNGQLLWSMMQSGRIEDRFPDDYIYVMHKTRLPDSPFNKIIRAIAKDMAIPLKSWLPDPDEKYTFASNAREMKSELAPAPAHGGEEVATGPDMVEDLPAESQKEISASEVKSDRPDVNGINLDVRFDLDKATIREESFPLLDALGEALNSKELKGRQIIIAGHTDSTGDEAYNLTLSKKRAQSVKDYLVNKWGIVPDTLEAVGYGQTRPLNQGKTTEERQLNRRVEIRLAE